MAERSDVAIQRRTDDEAPARSAETIRNDIAAKRESISDTVDKLGERISETFNWREYVAEYPVVALGLAAGAGLLIAGIFKRQPTPQERIMEAVAELTEDMKERVGDAIAGTVQKRLLSSRTVKAAVATMATKAGVEFLRGKLANQIEASRSRTSSAHDTAPSVH